MPGSIRRLRLPLAIVVERYNGFLHSPEDWILNRLVLPAARLPEVTLEAGWRVTLLVEEEPGPLPPQVETLETALPRQPFPPHLLRSPAGRDSGAFAKIRTGGLSTEKIPSTEHVAEFLRARRPGAVCHSKPPPACTIPFAPCGR